MQITNVNQEYEQKYMSLQYENETLKHEKQTYQRKCTDLQNENSMIDDNKNDEKESPKLK